MTNDVKCDTCGSPEVCFGERDIEETEPTIINGVLWANFRPKSEWRYGCIRHPPEIGRIFWIEKENVEED